MYLHHAERLLAEHGWVLVRVNSSHRMYRNVQGQTLTVAAHGQRMTARPDQLHKDLRRLVRMGAAAGERRRASG
jgi:predicted RNA binding protein YcfA (HicA-like mRNA interferase family)